MVFTLKSQEKEIAIFGTVFNFSVKFQEFEKPVVWPALGRGAASAYFVDLLLHVCIFIHMHASQV